MSSSSGTSSLLHDERNSMQKTGEFVTIRSSNRLDGKNYLKWSQLVRTYLKGKGKISHLLGPGPAEDDPKFQAWDEDDSMIMSWLWDSMEPMISDACMFFGTAREIWEYVRRTYSKANDVAQVYEIKVKTAATKQGDKSVTEYASILQHLWQELDHYRVFELKDPADAVILKQFIERDRVYDFLAGLNPEFDQVRVQILGREEPLMLAETISIVRAEESRRGVMLPLQSMDHSALASKVANYQEKGKGEVKGQWKESREEIFCTYCKKPWHTKEKCWKLHGKPTDRAGGNKGGYRPRPQAHIVDHTVALEDDKSASSSLGDFTSTDIARLKKMLGSMEQSSGACTLAQSGISSLPLCFSASEIAQECSWIIDSGATDHMTPSSKLFQTYTPCPSNRKILVANGALVTVAGFGNIFFSPSLILKNVLHVPKLSASLISTKRLTTDLNCFVIFSPSYCLFQDQITGRRIGHAKEKNSLYYLESPVTSESVSVSHFVSSNKDAIMMYHFRLGHPSFQSLKLLFPKLFLGFDVSDFHCNTCTLAKQTRVSFPLSNEKCSVPFQLIHSDV